MASSNMSLKLLIDKKGQRVLFAEANKEFVDFLFHIFSLPLGTLIEFLGSKQMVGCFGKLKESIDSFNQTYLQPGINKNDISNPKTPFSGNTFLLPYNTPFVEQSGAPTEIYKCSSIYKISKCHKYVSVYADSKCPGCRYPMNAKMTLVLPNDKVAKEFDAEADMKKGYVKEVVTYMVMDDLVVKPMSTVSSITLINSFGVKDLSQLEEKTVSFGKKEGLKLLKNAFTSNAVLTKVFVREACKVKKRIKRSKRAFVGLRMHL